MKMDLGELIDIKIEPTKNPKVKARVAWLFERAELKWGIIMASQGGGDWVQLPKFRAGFHYLTPLLVHDKSLEDQLFKAALDRFYEDGGEILKIEEINLEDFDKLIK